MTPPRSRRRSRAAATLLLLVPTLAVTLAGCGDEPVRADNVAAGDLLLPPGDTRFAEPRLTWAQGRTLHYGDRRFVDVVDRDILGLLRTPSGFLLRLDPDDGGQHEHDEVVLWDGVSLTTVSSAVSSFEVSADGRYAGWLERDPYGLRGGLAAVRVVDLTTGEAVLSTTEGMGDPADGADELAELYANAWPHFAGFDALGRAYWHRASGDVTDVRLDLPAGEEEPGVDEGEGFPRGMLWEDNRGYRALGAAAAHLPAAWVQRDGLVTPDEEVFVDETDGVVKVYRESAPRRAVRLPTGHRFAWFHGWADREQHRIVLLVRDRNEGGFDPAAPDDTTGWIVTCDVDDATCDDGIEVTATRSVVFDDGLGGPGQG